MAPDWTFDERRHAGSEHLDPTDVARFDEKSPFDPSPELERFIDRGLTTEDAIVDFGTGTGVFPLAAADHCDRVIAIDISETMLELVREKIDAEGVQNVELVNDGLVSYEHDGAPVSFAFSKDALHHLPDFWKIEALKTVGNTLEPGGVFRLRDFVFSFDPEDSIEEIESWLATKESTPFTEAELHTHFQNEFSTYGFLLESMLEETGFEILESAYEGGLYASYTCEWRGDLE